MNMEEHGDPDETTCITVLPAANGRERIKEAEIKGKGKSIFLRRRRSRRDEFSLALVAFTFYAIFSFYASAGAA